MEKAKRENGFNYAQFRQQAIARMLGGDRAADRKELTGKDGVLAPLLKDLLDAALSGELQAHVEENRPNRHNGSNPKQVKTAHGQMEVQMPRDRDGSFEPQLIAKRGLPLGEGWITASCLFTAKASPTKTSRDQKQGGFLFGNRLAQGALLDHPAHHGKMDDAAGQLGSDHPTTLDSLRRPGQAALKSLADDTLR